MTESCSVNGIKNGKIVEVEVPINGADEIFLSTATLAQRYEVSKHTIWRWAAAGRLPSPVRFSQTVLRWKLSELIEFENQAA